MINKPDVRMKIEKKDLKNVWAFQQLVSQRQVSHPSDWKKVVMPIDASRIKGIAQDSCTSSSVGKDKIISTKKDCCT
ncbi:unnamed protein product [Arctia plantaginis]|uniref:Uncharacterized protein n=1 Tax=Arctia plantaginis TaxID=874455 RepID=A0A8S1ATI4_ARCPL|nr:unnamed protein product [Arctia plantaginis]